MSALVVPDERCITLPFAPPDSPEWHEQRRQAIGGSEAAACVGLDPYESPLALWLVKTGQVPAADETEAMTWGRRMEDAIAAEWAERTGLHLMLPPATFARADLPFMHANVDRLVFESPFADDVALGLAEIKLTHDTARWDDGPPDHHVLQVQHYLAVTGFQVGWLIGLLSERRFRLVVHVIERDEQLIERLVAAEAEMWRRILEADPPAASVGDRAVLSAAYPQPEPGRSVTLPPSAAVVLDELGAARARRKRAEDDCDRFENQLRAWLGDAERGVVGDREAVTWKAHEVQRLDTTALRKDQPETYAAYARTTTQRRLLIGGHS